jgi:hypothetical protein
MSAVIPPQPGYSTLNMINTEPPDGIQPCSVQPQAGVTTGSRTAPGAGNMGGFYGMQTRKM